MAEKSKYHAPEKDVPNVGGTPSVVATLAVIASLIFAGWSFIDGGSWVKSVFYLLVGGSLLAILVWVERLNSYRQEEVTAQHRERFERNKFRWITHTVIPRLHSATSITLTFAEASELAYTGSINKELDSPYASRIHHIEFAVDAKNHPIVTLYDLSDQYLTEGSAKELVASVPFSKSRRCLLRRIMRKLR